MRGGIGPVGRQSDFDNLIGLYIKVFSSRGTVGYIGLEYHDARMTFAQAYFILGANHAFRHFPTNFCFLDGKGLAAGRIYRGAGKSDHHALSLRDVGSTTNNWQHLASTDVDG